MVHCISDEEMKKLIEQIRATSNKVEYDVWNYEGTSNYDYPLATRNHPLFCNNFEDDKLFLYLTDFVRNKRYEYGAQYMISPDKSLYILPGLPDIRNYPDDWYQDVDENNLPEITDKDLALAIYNYGGRIRVPHTRDVFRDELPGHKEEYLIPGTNRLANGRVMFEMTEGYNVWEDALMPFNFRIGYAAAVRATENLTGIIKD